MSRRFVDFNEPRSDDRVELREVAVQPHVPFGEKLVLISGAHAPARRFTVAGVKSIDDFHSRDDAAEWRESFSVVVPVVAQVDEDCVARVPGVVNAYASVPRSFETRAGSSAIVAVLQTWASFESPGNRTVVRLRGSDHEKEGFCTSKVVPREVVEAVGADWRPAPMRFHDEIAAAGLNAHPECFRGAKHSYAGQADETEPRKRPN